MRAIASSVLIAVLLCLFAAISAAAQQQEQQPEWTWKDGQGEIRSRADLDKILEKHKLWLADLWSRPDLYEILEQPQLFLDSVGKKGDRADLSGALSATRA